MAESQIIRALQRELASQKAWNVRLEAQIADTKIRMVMVRRRADHALTSLKRARAAIQALKAEVRVKQAEIEKLRGGAT